MTFSQWLNKSIYQIAHVSTTAFLVLLVSFFLNPFLTTAIGIGISGIKESLIDPRVEDKATQGSGWEDFIFLSTGCLLGLVTRLLIKYLKGF